MKKIIGCLFGVLVLGLCSLYVFKPFSRYQYELAICTMFKNEAPWFKEWIVYHHDILGFEHFYLYDNDSTDNYMEVLQPFIDKGIVEVIEWNSTKNHCDEKDLQTMGWTAFQVGAFNDCIKSRALGKAKWVAVFDVDEYLVPAHGASSLRAFLRRKEKKNVGSVKFFWKIFGTSNVCDLKPGELLTEKLVRRASDCESFWWYNHVKSIHRPEAVAYCHIHDAPKLHKGFKCREAKQDEFLLNHYWAGTEKRCAEKREKNLDFLDRLNAQEDRKIAQYLPALKMAMNQY